MPNKRAAIKDLRKNKKRATKNMRLKTHIKSLSRKLKDSVSAGKKDEAKQIAKDLQQITAKAARVHVIHTNKAGHIMSAAMKSVSKM